MRIIAGRAGGITIKAPPAGTRPTTDRVREALFSMLGDLVPGACVLDLFAGSGALGLEALSRGAREVSFVERQAAACAIIEENVRRAKLDSARVIKSEVSAALRKFADSGAQFDLIFADPPYAKQLGEADLAVDLLKDENLPRVLAPDGWLSVETMVTKQAPRAIFGWQIVRDRAYGSTRVLLLQRTSHAEIPDSAAV
ncbi:MAG: 16S rRNA (guanine(966)-N(2))-methyltransferase RsmD [Verrucomicrobia bacterium]|nr:16S rRNA (guanine(966)-N(2))-methyltransferase RsmD [Verrucomicrobiota bacterium]